MQLPKRAKIAISCLTAMAYTQVSGTFCTFWNKPVGNYAVSVHHSNILEKKKQKASSGSHKWWIDILKFKMDPILFQVTVDGRIMNHYLTLCKQNHAGYDVMPNIRKDFIFIINKVTGGPFSITANNVQSNNVRCRRLTGFTKKK